MERATGSRDGGAPTSSPRAAPAETGQVTSEQLLTVLACAMIGFASIVAGYHLPSLLPALRRVVVRDRR